MKAGAPRSFADLFRVLPQLLPFTAVCAWKQSCCGQVTFHILPLMSPRSRDNAEKAVWAEVLPLRLGSQSGYNCSDSFGKWDTFQPLPLPGEKFCFFFHRCLKMSEGSGEVLQWVRIQSGMEGWTAGAWEPSREGFRVDLIHAGALGLTWRLLWEVRWIS